jgi:hypothetical protein
MALEYAAGDVDVIERLYDVFRPQVTDEEWELVLVETDNRLLRAMLPNKSRHNARAPASFAFLPSRWCTLEDEEYIIEAIAVVSEEINEFWVPEGEQELWVANDQSLGEYESNESASEESWDHGSVEVADDVGDEGEELNATKSNLWNDA